MRSFFSTVLLFGLALLAVGCVIEPNPSPATGSNAEDQFASDTSAPPPFDTGLAGAMDANTGPAEDAVAADAAEPDDAGLTDIEDDAMFDVAPDDVAPDAVAEDDVDDTEATETSAGPDCQAAAGELTKSLYAQLGSCTAVVRLAYTDRQPLGYALVCGKYANADAASAKAQAQADTGLAPEAMLMGDASAEDVWVFWQEPGDLGAAAAVSVRTGLTVFGGSIVWDGAGDLTWPMAWEEPASLASDCDPEGGIPTQRGLDLRTGEVLADGDVAAAVDVVAQTALLDAFWAGGYAFDAVVLLYPRSVGAFDPATAEWVVLLNGGWLD